MSPDNAFLPGAASPSPLGQADASASSALQEARIALALADKKLWAAARPHYAEAIRLQPSNAEFHWLSGMCDWQLGLMQTAGDHLQRAVRLSPQFGLAQASLGQWYLLNGIVDAALLASAKSMELVPDNNDVTEGRAWVLEAAGDMDTAWELVRRLMARGHTSSSLVRLHARLAPRHGEAEQALTHINRFLDTGQEPPVDQSGLHFAAANLLEDLGRYNEAFAHATRANALRRGNYNPLLQQRVFDKIIAYFTPERVRSIRTTCRSDKPVFIVGMPRSGTSLLEQIVASHPQVHGAGELDFLFQVYLGTLDMLKASEDSYPFCLGKLSVDQADGMAQIYLKPLLALNPNATRIVDKMPLNFLHLGLIAMLIPDARIIHCRRDPLDTCVSCYTTNFNYGHEFKYDLTHLGLFYRQYERLMNHWRQVLDIPMLDVDYEQVIADPDGQSRRLIDFLGLPWDDRCLRFHETQRPVATASVHQVRKPIYNTSVQRRRRYEKHLTPLKAALDAGTITVPNTAN